MRDILRDQANAIGNFQPSNNAPYGNTYHPSWRNHPSVSWNQNQAPYSPPVQPPSQTSSMDQAILNLTKLVGDFVREQKTINIQISQRIDHVETTLNKKMDELEDDLSQKIDNLQDSISWLTTLNPMQEEEGKFPSQPQQNHVENEMVEDFKDQVETNVTLRNETQIEQLILSSQDEDEENLEEIRLFESLMEEKWVDMMEDEPKKVFENIENEVVEAESVGFVDSNFHGKEKQSTLLLFDEVQPTEEKNERLSKLALKPLPSELKYAYLDDEEKFLVVISSQLSSHQESSLLNVLRTSKETFGWTILDWKEDLMETYMLQASMKEPKDDMVKEDFVQFGERAKVWRINEDLQILKLQARGLMKQLFGLKKMKQRRHAKPHTSKAMKKKCKEWQALDKNGSQWKEGHSKPHLTPRGFKFQGVGPYITCKIYEELGIDHKEELFLLDPPRQRSLGF